MHKSQPTGTPGPAALAKSDSLHELKLLAASLINQAKAKRRNPWPNTIINDWVYPPDAFFLLEALFPERILHRVTDKPMSPADYVIDNGIVSIIDNKVCTSSRMVAQVFNKRHADVLRAVERLENHESFNERNFASVGYKDAKGENRKEIIMTRDGFTYLAMGFTGKEAAKFKIDYIEAFNQMERLLKLPVKPSMTNEERLMLELEAAKIALDIERCIHKTDLLEQRYEYEYNRPANGLNFKFRAGAVLSA